MGHAFVRRSLSSILAICDIPRRRQEGPPHAADLNSGVDASMCESACEPDSLPSNGPQESGTGVGRPYRSEFEPFSRLDSGGRCPQERHRVIPTAGSSGEAHPAPDHYRRNILHRIRSSIVQRGWPGGGHRVRGAPGETMFANQCRSFWFWTHPPRFSFLAVGAVGAWETPASSAFSKSCGKARLHRGFP